jgi:hydroxyacylglutathione hydrolase
MNTKQAILNTSRDRFGAPSEQVNAQFVARLPAHLHRIKAFEDNYLWMLQDPGSNLCWVVDPGDGKVLIEAAASRGLQIVGVLLTHHHADHQGGVDDLLQWASQRGQSLSIYGPSDERIHPQAKGLADGDRVDLGFAQAQVISVPGHTRSHIAYFLAEENMLFCGDCLFAAGCGRLFEGNPAQMLDSLAKLCTLPADSLVCCAHEYTLSNLRFAKAAHPNHAAINARLSEAESMRDRDLSTVPSLLMHELQTNPFLLGLVDQAPIHPAESHLANKADRIARFAELRAWKNEFRA